MIGRMRGWHWVSIILVATSIALMLCDASAGTMSWWQPLITIPINAATISIVCLSLGREK